MHVETDLNIIIILIRINVIFIILCLRSEKGTCI